MYGVGFQQSWRGMDISELTMLLRPDEDTETRDEGARSVRSPRGRMATRAERVARAAQRHAVEQGEAEVPEDNSNAGLALFHTMQQFGMPTGAPPAPPPT